MLIWNTLDSCAVATLNDNLIISYWLPGMEQYSGLSVVGEHAIDETICAVFDHMLDGGESPRLVHVPESVITHIKHPELFVCKPERDFDEYVFKISDFCPLNNVNEFRRKRVKNFITNVGEESIVVKSLDLKDRANVRLLLDCTESWYITGKPNARMKFESNAIGVALANHDVLGIENLCLFVDGELQGFCLYHRSRDNRYIFGVSARFNAVIPYAFDYGLYAFCRKFADEGASYLNMDYDLGNKFMRTLKLSLGPSEFIHKYTIEPAGAQSEL
jgi:hypothetical protein